MLNLNRDTNLNFSNKIDTKQEDGILSEVQQDQISLTHSSKVLPSLQDLGLILNEEEFKDREACLGTLSILQQWMKMRF